MYPDYDPGSSVCLGSIWPMRFATLLLHGCSSHGDCEMLDCR